jgi:2'-5' RNA ligase
MFTPDAALSDEDIAVAYRATRCTLSLMDVSSTTYRKIHQDVTPLLDIKQGYALGTIFKIQRDLPIPFGKRIKVDTAKGKALAFGHYTRSYFLVTDGILVTVSVPPQSSAPIKLPSLYPTLPDISNVGYFFHGTPPENLFGVLSRGLQMPRTTIQQNLSSKNTAAKLRLGQGIYFAKDPVTSMKYTSPTRDGRLYLFVAGALSTWAPRCMAPHPLDDRFHSLISPSFFSPDLPHAEIARGNAYTTTADMSHLTAPPPGYDSVHALGRATKPMSNFDADEYVVYNVAQQRVKFIIELVPSAAPLPAEPPSAEAPNSLRSKGSFSATPASRSASLRNSRPVTSSSTTHPPKQPRELQDMIAAPKPQARVAPVIKPEPPAVPQPRGKPLGKRRRFDMPDAHAKQAWAEPLCHNTALVLCAEGDLATEIDSIRGTYDMKHVNIWPPHVTLLYPFVQPQDMAKATRQLSEVKFDAAALHLSLERVGTFDQGSKGHLHYLAPSPASNLRQLHEHICSALEGCFGSAKPLTTPHLTIARGQRSSIEAALQDSWQARAFHPTALVVLQRDAVGQPMQEVARISLNWVGERTAATPLVPDDWRLFGQGLPTQSAEKTDEAAATEEL